MKNFQNENFRAHKMETSTDSKTLKMFTVKFSAEINFRDIRAREIFYTQTSINNKIDNFKLAKIVRDER